MNEPTPPTRPAAAESSAVRLGATPDVVTSRLVLEFYEFWRMRCRGGRLPPRSAFDPVDMRRFLANIILIEVLRDPLDFRYRIIGERIIERLGNMTGKRVNENPLANVSSSAYRNYCAVVESRAPQFLEGLASTAFRSDLPSMLSRVHCPLADDGETVDHIISCVTFQSA